MTAFDNNYFYELPEEIQAIIYKKVFNNTLNLIGEQREALDNYDKLVEYIKKNHYDPYKSRAIWSIMLCYRKEIGDPYYKYFLYYADNETDFLRLNKTKMIKYNSAYSTIKYLEFSIYPMKDTLPTDNYNSVKKVLEEYANIFLSNFTDKYQNIKGVRLLNDKLQIEYKDTYIFKCYIDIYNNILETYNFTTYIFNILNMYNHLYPVYNLKFMNDIIDLRDWFEYNSFFCGFTLNDDGDAIIPRFYSARYC